MTLNPAVDKTYETTELMKGQVNRMRSSISLAGGKGINVAKILRQFDRQTAVTGFLGGYTGRMIEETMLKMGAECHFTRIAGETRTSINILADSGFVTEVLEPGPVVTPREKEIFQQEFAYCLERAELVAVCGSVPPGIAPDFYSGLVTQCREAGKKVIVDTSGDLLREAVKSCPYMIKPNRREMEYLTGRKLRTIQDIAEEAHKLVDGGIGKVVVSLGDNGLLYVDGEYSIHMDALEVEAVNTVGCGDSVVASLCMSVLDGEEPQEALHKAIALSAANAVTRESGDIPMDIYREFLNR